MMSEHTAEDLRELLDTVYRSESRRVLATLIRLLGDFDRAEEALHDAFAAVERALSSRQFGPYTLKAAIAAVHAEAPNVAATDWAEAADFPPENLPPEAAARASPGRGAPAQGREAVAGATAQEWVRPPDIRTQRISAAGLCAR